MTPQASEKLKATFALGISSNYSTLFGIVLGWVTLAKSGWVGDFWSSLFTAFLMAPAFMGDAINSYVLGKIRLDTLKNWDDIQVTPEGRKALDRLHLFWRGLSFLTAALLAGIFITSFAPQPGDWRFVKVLFLATFILHFLRCNHSVSAYMAPRVPFLGGMALMRRMVLTGSIFSAWMVWLWIRNDVPFSSFGMILHGTVFFLLCGAFQPLPSRFSVFQPGKLRPKKISTKVEPLESAPEDAPSAEAVRLLRDAWTKDGSFERVGPLQMPLLELPIFQAVGEALLSKDRRILLLLLQSEVRERVHRVLISAPKDTQSPSASAGGGFLAPTPRFLITTDFGSPKAHFPETWTYLTRAFEEGDPLFLSSHRERLSVELREIASPPWPFLNEMLSEMSEFLQRTAPKEGTGAEGKEPGGEGENTSSDSSRDVPKGGPS